jgi:hypothetical protein
VGEEMNLKERKNLSLVFLFLVVLFLILPYLHIVFFRYTIQSFLEFIGYFISYFIAIIFFTGYFFIETKKKNRWIGLVVILCAPLFFFYTAHFFNNIGERIYFNKNAEKFNEFVSEIKEYGKIKEMSDGRRYTKTLNDSIYEFTEKDVQTRGFRAKLLSDLLINMGIDAEVHSKFRDKLTENDFTGFETFKDGTISFTIDGMLDNCYGFAYSETGEHPMFNDCGTIIRWEKVEGNWYAWGTT